jgi:hypothetical protein
MLHGGKMNLIWQLLTFWMPTGPVGVVQAAIFPVQQGLNLVKANMPREFQLQLINAQRDLLSINAAIELHESYLFQQNAQQKYLEIEVEKDPPQISNDRSSGGAGAPGGLGGGMRPMPRVLLEALDPDGSTSSSSRPVQAKGWARQASGREDSWYSSRVGTGLRDPSHAEVFSGHNFENFVF